MTNIIGLTLAYDEGEEHRVFINADNVTHWHHKKNRTVVFFSGGDKITVNECPWEILDRIEPEPDYYADSE